MELKTGDLVVHVSQESLGYGLVMSPTSVLYNYSCLVCSVQWIDTGRVHLIDVDFLNKINKDKK